MLSSTLSMIALLGLVALLGGMFARHWASFRAALIGQAMPQTAPLAPPAETNVVMLRPPIRQAPFSRQHSPAQDPLARAA